MTKQRVIAILGLILAAAIVVWLAVSAFWNTAKPQPADWSRLITGVRSFVADTKASGKPLPASVSLRELVEHGSLAAADVRVFEGMEVTFPLGGDETKPQRALVQVRMADGTELVLLADGSVQQVAK